MLSELLGEAINVLGWSQPCRNPAVTTWAQLGVVEAAIWTKEQDNPQRSGQAIAEIQPAGKPARQAPAQGEGKDRRSGKYHNGVGKVTSQFGRRLDRLASTDLGVSGVLAGLDSRARCGLPSLKRSSLSGCGCLTVFTFHGILLFLGASPPSNVWELPDIVSSRHAIEYSAPYFGDLIVSVGL